jgi:hypothetical protein
METVTLVEVLDAHGQVKQRLRVTADGELRVAGPAHETLVQGRRFSRHLLLRYRTALAVAGMLLCLAFAAFLQWTYAPAQLAERVVIAELLAVAVLALWVGAWALVSRLTVGAWQVRMHLAIAAICVALWVWGYCLYSLAAFALQWRWLAPVMIALAALVAFAAAYLHLRNATRFHRLVALLLAALVPPLLGGVWWLIDLQVDPRTVNRIELGPDPYLPALRMAPSVDAGDYLSDLSELKRDANRNRQESLLESPILDAEEVE